jgi:O-antigen/teichoic acid export membrane protein
MLNILKPKLKSKFSRDILTLVTGTSIANVIPIIIMPVLTRLWSPNDFGVFAIYMALVGILGTLSAGRLDLALILPKKDKIAKSILIIGLTLSFIFFLLLYLLIFIIDQISTISEFSFRNWYYWIPIGVISYAIYSMLISWCNRKKNYKLMTLSRIIQSTSISFVQVFTGLTIKLNFGLLISDLIGRVLTIIFIIKHTGLFKIKIAKKTNYIKLLKRYKKFPLVEAPASFINILSHQLPIIILPLIFSPVIGGLYFLTVRVLTIPTSLLGLAMLEVFKNRAQEDFRRIGSCRPIFIKMGLVLFFIGLVPALFFFFFAPTFFVYVFGAQWREAGEYAQILAPLALMQFVCSPLSYVLIFREKLFLDLKLQLAFLILIVIVLFLTAELNSIITTISLLTLSGCIFYLITLFFSYNYSKNK